MIKSFKHFTWIPHETPNPTKFREDADHEHLAARNLTIEDVTYEDQGEIEPHTYLTIFTPKPFLWLRRLFRGIF